VEEEEEEEEAEEEEAEEESQQQQQLTAPAGSGLVGPIAGGRTVGSDPRHGPHKPGRLHGAHGAASFPGFPSVAEEPRSKTNQLLFCCRKGSLWTVRSPRDKR